MAKSGDVHQQITKFVLQFSTFALAHWSSTGAADAATTTRLWQSRSELNNAHESWPPGLYSDGGLFQNLKIYQWVSCIMTRSDSEQLCPFLPGQACHLTM